MATADVMARTCDAASAVAIVTQVKTYLLGTGMATIKNHIYLTSNERPPDLRDRCLGGVYIQV